MPLAFSQWHLYRLDFMVEAAGVEPASESTSSEPSPGADDIWKFPSDMENRHTIPVSSFIMHGALKALRTHEYH